jgi:hypothetical protein
MSIYTHAKVTCSRSSLYRAEIIRSSAVRLLYLLMRTEIMLRVRSVVRHRAGHVEILVQNCEGSIEQVLVAAPNNERRWQCCQLPRQIRYKSSRSRQIIWSVLNSIVAGLSII